MSGTGIRTMIGAFLGVVGARLAWAFLDELVGLEASARSAARSVSSSTVTREVSL